MNRSLHFFRLISAVSFFVTIVNPLFAQKDTTHLQPFVVSDQPVNSSWPGNHQIFDSIQRLLTMHGTLADLLSRTSPVTMRYYGPGQLASAAFRGASASQTVVVWNGIRINNPMLMQTDLSSIPLTFIDNGRILFGSSALGNASGAFGGVISLSSANVGTNTQSVSVNMSAGSYGLKVFNAELNWKYRNTTSETVYFTEHSYNDYLFKDNFTSGNPLKRRADASWSSKGIMHQTGYSNSNGLTGSVMLSGQQRFINIPYPIHQPQGKYTQIQSEDNWRLFIHNSVRRNRTEFSSATGIQYGVMNYLESRSGTDAEHLTANFQQRFEVLGQKGKSRWKLSADYEMQHVFTSAYKEAKERNIMAIFGSLMRPWGRVFRYGADIRSEYIPGYGFDVMPAAFAAAVIGRNNSHTVKATFMKNRRIPGLNDLYWVPGGTPDLSPETGISAELTWEGFLLRKGKWTVANSFTVFHQMVDNKITWLPDSTAMWSARNIGKVKMKGAEMMIRISRIAGNNIFDLIIRAQYTDAVRITNDNETNHLQLVYIPVTGASSILRISTPYIVISAETSFAGKRYTNAANTSWLPAYTVTDIRFASGRVCLKFLEIRGFFAVMNVFDGHYQAMAWYPMPGRTFSIGLSVRFISR